MKEPQLIDFLLRANKAGYANENTVVKDYNDGMHEIVYTDGDWYFVDVWWGGDPFAGQSHIEYQSKTVWAMQYRGGMSEGHDHLVAEVFHFLRAALALATLEEPVRGPRELTQAEWRYQNDWTHDVTNFRGSETIWHNESIVHTCEYFGGFVNTGHQDL